MRIKVDQEISLRTYQRSDKENLIRHINDEEIYKNSLTIPFPYGSKEADQWLDLVLGEERTKNPLMNLVICDMENALIGGIGLLSPIKENTFKNELGYWLGRAYWNKGIMTKVVKTFSEYCMREKGLIRLQANVFDYNIASKRVLEKAGYNLEGKIQKCYRKEERIFGGYLFAKIS